MLGRDNDGFEVEIKPLYSTLLPLTQLMLGRDNYGFEVDMWAAGCVMGEMINNSVLFLGDDRADQIAQIINILGTNLEVVVGGGGGGDGGSGSGGDGGALW